MKPNIQLEKREDGRYILRENYFVTPDKVVKLPLKENTLVEKDGKSYKCIGAYTFPISRPNKENFNERIYTDKLWENVMTKQKEIWEGSFGLCDHPEDDGSVKDAWCVWHNLRFNEDRSLVLADAYLFGKWGKHAQEALEAGGKIGLSSVGYGDFKADGKTIDEETYEIERPADWVLNPSYNVFGYLEDNIPETDTINAKEKQEEVEKNNKNDKLFEDNKTNIEDSNKKEKSMSKQDILLEKNFRWHVEAQLKEIANIDSLKDKLGAYKELLENFNDVDFAEDLKKEIENFINETQKAIEELAEKGEKLDTVKESKELLEKKYKELQEKYKGLEEEKNVLQEKFDTAIGLLDDLKVYTNKLRDLYEIEKAESNGKVSASEYKELLVYVEGLEKENNELKKEIRKLKIQIKEKETSPIKHRTKLVKNKEMALKLLKKQKEENKVEKVEKEDRGFELNIRNDDEILAYYEDLYAVDPRVELIKEEILKCKTLFEAQKTYLHLKSLYEDTPSPYKPKFEKQIRVKEKMKEEKDIMDDNIDLSRIKHEGWI